MATRNLAVMFTDIKGFTARTSASTRDGVRSLLDEHDRLLRPVFRHFDGTIVKTLGDAFLVYFESPTDAVVCGLAIQSVLKKFNAAVSEEERIAVRVAINIGDVEMVDGDVLGEPVNIAARLESITDPGEVWFTEAVYLTMNRKEAPSAEIGERVFKGIPIPVRVYKVISDPPSEQILQIDRSVHLERGVPRIEGIGPTRAPGPSWRPWAAAVILTLLLGPLLGIFGYEAFTSWRTEKQIANLLAMDDPGAALEVMEAVLLERPDDRKIRELALFATEKHLERRLARGDDSAELLEWLSGEIRDKGYLDPLRPRLAQLEAEVTLKEAISGSGRDRAFWEAFRGLLDRHPKSVEVPLVAVDVLKASNRVSSVMLWPYELVVERGGLPGDPKLLESIFEACTDTLKSASPDSSYGERAHRLMRELFADRQEPWAYAALQEGEGLAVLNALEILNESGDERAREPFFIALRALSKADADEEQIETLRSIEDSRQASLVLEVMTATRPNMRAGISQEAKDAYRQLQTELQGRWR